MEGDFFIGAALGTTLAKLAMRYNALVHDKKRQNHFSSEAMLIVASVLHLGKSGMYYGQSPNPDFRKSNVGKIKGLHICLL